jgi:hypothetical protein
MEIQNNNATDGSIASDSRSNKIAMLQIATTFSDYQLLMKGVGFQISNQGTV